MRRAPCPLAFLAALAATASGVAWAEEPPPLPPPESQAPPLPPPEPAPPRSLPSASAQTPVGAPALPSSPLPPQPAAPPPALALSPPAPTDAPVLAPWDPDTPVPPGYVLRSEPQTGLIFAGSAMVSIGWVTSVAVGLIAAQEESDRGIDGDGVEADDWAPLYFPVGGPFATIASVDASGAGTGMLVFDGVLQLAGVGLIVFGSLSQTHRAAPLPSLGGAVTLVPSASARGPGFALKGAF